MSNYRRQPGDADRLAEQLRAEQARGARLAAELLLEREKVRQLEQAYNHKDNEAWHQHATIETLKVELRAIATSAAQLQGRLLGAPQAPSLPAAPAAAETLEPVDAPAEEATPAAQEAQLGLKMALMDLEDRLQLAVGLVLNELNTRKAAEARIQELEQQLAVVRRRIGSGPPAP